MADAIALL